MKMIYVPDIKTLFLFIDLLKLHLISYHPTGYVRLISSTPNPTIEITDPKYLNMFKWVGINSNEFE